MRAQDFLTESNYKEIEFICVNPQFPEATDPEKQQLMYAGLTRIPGVIPLMQEWSDYSEGQRSLSAIYKDRAARAKILALAKQLGVKIDLEQPVNDEYVDRAIQGEHEGQVVDEMAGSIHGGVRDVLMGKGYRYLGSGIDKQAWLEPGTGQVLIVFGYRQGYDEFSPDQRMFIDWINYCNQHKNNPHLPRFSGFESFAFRGKNYIQARMEALKKLPDNVREVVADLADYVDHSDNPNIKNILMDLLDSEGLPGNIEHHVNQLGGIDAVTSLIKTIQQVMAFGMQHGFNIDLHGDNYMMREDGTIIVNDPFVLWLREE